MSFLNLSQKYKTVVHSKKTKYDFLLFYLVNAIKHNDTDNNLCMNYQCFHQIQDFIGTMIVTVEDSVDHAMVINRRLK